MAEQSDHDRIVILETQVDDILKWKNTLTTYLDQKLDRADDKNDSRFTALDQKFEAKVTGLQDHMDSKFDWFHEEMMSTLQAKEAETPHWVGNRIKLLVGLLGAAATLIAALVTMLGSKGW